MRSSLRWPTATLHHLSDEMALALPSELDFHWPIEEIRAIVANQVVLALPYWDFLGAEHIGQLVIHRDIAEAVRDIFEQLFEARFPIGGMAPIAAFVWDDHRSMAANNCVGFDFRPKTGRTGRIGKDDLSSHAYGRAIDINPLVNPYQKDGLVLPAGAVYVPDHPGACTPDSLPVALFRAHGFTWGGEWQNPKDYMHFEFPFQP